MPSTKIILFHLLLLTCIHCNEGIICKTQVSSFLPTRHFSIITRRQRQQHGDQQFSTNFNERKRTSITSSSIKASVFDPDDDNLNSTDEPSIDKRLRFLSALPKITRRQPFGDNTDRKILKTALPSMLNLAVVPIVNSVDTYWVGRLGIALALAGQAAANQAFFTFYFLISFLPTIMAPLVAKAVGSGDMESANDRVCEALFLSIFFGIIGTILLVGFPTFCLGLVLTNDAPSMAYAVPYLRFRALSMIPALISATGFAAFRGMLDTVTPLKVSLVTNISNLIADPILIFGLPLLSIGRGLGVSGAAIATAGAESLGGIIYIGLLIKKKLLNLVKILKPPSWSNLKPIIQGGMAMFVRNLTLNASFLVAARRAQAMDPTGVSAAAYGIVMQIYSVGVVCHLGIQSTAASLLPSTRASSGDVKARNVADKLFVWGSIVGIVLAIVQLALQPVLLPMFSTIKEVQEAVKVPALISSFMHLLNGPVFAGEGIMLGLGSFKALAICTAIGTGIMITILLNPFLGSQLNGILLSIAAFQAFQAFAMILYHLKLGPLSTVKEQT